MTSDGASSAQSRPVLLQTGTGVEGAKSLPGSPHYEEGPTWLGRSGLPSPRKEVEAASKERNEEKRRSQEKTHSTQTLEGPDGPEFQRKRHVADRPGQVDDHTS